MDSLFFHPKVVHLPIALSVLMPLVAGITILAWWRKWLPPRSWVLVILLQAALAGTGLLALETGESEEEIVERVVPEQAVEAHEEAAELFTWVSFGVLALMVLALVLSRGRTGLPVAAAATFATLVVAGLGFRTGQAGGELVYHHNAASVHVDRFQSNSPPSGANKHQADEDHEDDD